MSSIPSIASATFECCRRPNGKVEQCQREPDRVCYQNCIVESRVYHDCKAARRECYLSMKFERSTTPALSEQARDAHLAEIFVDGLSLSRMIVSDECVRKTLVSTNSYEVSK